MVIFTFNLIYLVLTKLTQNKNYHKLLSLKSLYSYYYEISLT